MRNFGRFVGIDWSGAKAPEFTRAIAVASCGTGDAAPDIPEQLWSREAVAEHLADIAHGSVRTLAGIDCNFGYSEMVGMRQFGNDYAAADLWQAVEAANRDRPNYFAGGYWVHEEHGRHFWQTGKRPAEFDMPRRATEQVCGDQGCGWPESPFKLIGPKQVGKGGLAGMRLLHDLKQRLGRRLAVWPFDVQTDDAVLVITEIYPRLFLRMAGHGNAKIRDWDGLNAALSALGSRPMPAGSNYNDHQADAIVSAAGLRHLCGTAKTVPETLSNPPAPRRTLEREGWIFGVKGQTV